MHNSSPDTVTARLRLSRLVSTDAEDVLRVYGDPDTWTHLPEGRFTSVAHARDHIAKAVASWDGRGAGTWAIRVTAEGADAELHEGQFIGCGGLQHISAGDVWNLGYRLSPESWGRGFATEVARAALALANTVAPEIPVTGRVLTNNPASVAVLEKIGLTLVWEGLPASDRTPHSSGPLRRVYADRELTPAAYAWLLANV